uniref:Uncharacterized protein n=1 Tax=Otus sunia TaxID=257818 RepID=A0A8C8AHE3_9STRI
MRGKQLSRCRASGIWGRIHLKYSWYLSSSQSMRNLLSSRWSCPQHITYKTCCCGSCGPQEP